MSSPIDAVGPQATLPADYDPSRAKVNSTGAGKPTSMLDSEAFLQLLVAQLKYQDPTNPVDTSNFMNQTAMLSQVQTMNTMSSTLTELMTAQQTASATAMIGKAISFVDPAGKQVAGIVDAVSMNKGTAMLHVGDLAVPLAGVLAVANPVATGGTDAPGSADGAGGTGSAEGAGAVDGTSNGTGQGGTSGTNNAGTAGGSDSGSTESGGAGSTSDSTGNDAVPGNSTAAPQGSTDPGAGQGATDPGALTPTIRPDIIDA